MQEMNKDTGCKGLDIPGPADISDEDVYEAMKEIPGYLDITPGDFKEIFHLAYRHAIDRFAKSVKAREVMTETVITVSRNTPLKEAADIMAKHRISGVPVIDSQKISGMLTEKDFGKHMASEGAMAFMDIMAECLKGKGCLVAPIRKQYAEDIMTTPAITVELETSIMEIANIFVNKNINRVPVTGNAGNLVGIISRTDILQSYLLGKKN